MHALMSQDEQLVIIGEYICYSDARQLKNCLIVHVYILSSRPQPGRTPAWQDPLTASQSLCELTVSKNKQFNNKHYSPPFYTTNKVTKCASVWMPVVMVVVSQRTGTHVSVFACLIGGGNMMNSYSGHSKMMSSFNSSNGGKTRDTKSIILASIDSQGDIGVGWGRLQFIPHSSLSYNPTTNAKYLQDDCLRLRVKTVVV